MKSTTTQVEMFDFKNRVSFKIMIPLIPIDGAGGIPLQLGGYMHRVQRIVRRYGPLHATIFITMNKNKYPTSNILLSTVLELWLIGILLVVGLLWCIGVL